MAKELDIEKFFIVLREISASIDSQYQLKPVLDTVVKKSADFLKAKGSLIRIFNPENRQLELMASYGLSRQYLFKGPVPKGNSTVDICRMNRLNIIKDVFNNPGIQYPLEVIREGICMIVEAPLNYANDILGVIRFFFGEQRDFNREELNFIFLIAERSAAVIHRARAFQEQQTRYNQLALQTEKLSALGRMAAGIAHEINNPLAGILLFSTNMLKKTAAESPIREGLEIIIQETVRCKTIIQELLEFSRESEPKKTPAEINLVVEKALAILENEFRLHHIRLERKLAEKLPRILIDQNQIEQILVNLLLNAVQAIGDRGVAKIETGLSPNHQWVTVVVSDTGCGILPEQLPRIFEPFFSTKPQGTGLGLAVTYGIIQKHGGQIRVESNPGQGTQMTLNFPVHHEGASDPREAA